MIWVLLICTLNSGISWWNAYVCGKIWEDSKTEGGFLHVLVWCAATQSAIGFSLVYLIAALGGVTVLAPESIPPETIQYLWELTFSIWYIAVIFPLLGTGLIITIHSWMEAVRRKDALSAGIAAYNTYAQVSNMVSAARNSGEAFGMVGDALGSLFKGGGSSDSAKGKVIILAFLMVLVALMAGILTTALLIQKYARTAPVLLESRQNVYGRQ
jgi:hypothetical protein